MSLRRRLALLTAVIVAVAVVAVATAAYLVAREELLAEVDASLEERIEVVMRAAEGPRPFREGIVTRPFIGPPAGRPSFDTLFYQLTRPDGTVIAPPGQELVLPRGSDGSEPTISDVTVEGVHLRMISAEVPGYGTVQIARPLDEVDAALAGLGLVLAGVGLLGTFGAGLVGLWVARTTLEPVDELTEAAEEVAETQDLGRRIETDRDDEIGRLAEAFNTMLEALATSREQQRRLVRDAGHELRTPLTSLRTNIELLARTPQLTDADRDELVAALGSEVVELTDLVDQVVDVASDRFRAEPPEPVDLAELVSGVVDRWSHRVDVPFEIDVDEPAAVEARPVALRRALDNLVDNAVKYGDGPITVRVAGRRVSVADRGPGIPPEERELVFARFHRGEAARSAAGSGLGLAIVAQIVEEHGGRVFVEDGAPGAVVGFELP